MSKAVNKKSITLDEEQAETPKRKRKLIDDLSRRYPGNSHSSIDSETIDQYLKAITEEMTTAKPREIAFSFNEKHLPNKVVLHKE